MIVVDASALVDVILGGTAPTGNNAVVVKTAHSTFVIGDSWRHQSSSACR